MKCRNCGKEFEGRWCPDCGRAAATGSNRVWAVLIAVLLFCPAAYVGTCSAVVLATPPSTREWDFRILAAFIGCVALVIAIGLGWLVVKLWRS
jgi:hypothetical protein